MKSIVGSQLVLSNNLQRRQAVYDFFFWFRPAGLIHVLTVHACWSLYGRMVVSLVEHSVLLSGPRMGHTNPSEGMKEVCGTLKKV
jgi:hypothetical protein